jgi:hypothetical protein
MEGKISCGRIYHFLQYHANVILNCCICCSYQPCDSPQNKIGGFVRINPIPVYCTDIDFNGQGGNPIIQFSLLRGSLPETVVTLSRNEVVPVDTNFFRDEKISAQELILASDLSDPACSSIAEQSTNKFFTVFGLYEGEYWIHDPRFVSVKFHGQNKEHDCSFSFLTDTFSHAHKKQELLANTAEKPSPDGGGAVVKATSNPKKTSFSTSCSNVARTFMNEDTCIVSDSFDVCSPSRPEIESEGQAFLVTIDETLLRAIYDGTRNLTSSTRFYYAVDGLRVEDDIAVRPPCQPSARSRWVRASADECNSQARTIQPATNTVLSIPMCTGRFDCS